jgi:hydrophobe/amphiphile efflux-3 (HAE3) family protein
VQSFVQRAATLIMEWRRLVGGGMALFAIGITAFALRLQTDFTVEDLFASDEAQRTATAEYRASFGNTDDILVLLVECDGCLAPGPLTYLRDLSTHVATRPWSAETASVTRLPTPQRRDVRPAADPISLDDLLRDVTSGALDTRPIVGDGPVTAVTAQSLADALARSPLVEGRLLSHDRTVAVISTLIRDDRQRADGLETIIAELETHLAAHPPPAGVRVHLGGLPFMRVDLVRSVGRDQAVLFPTAMLFVLLLLLLTFRWLPAVLLPLATVGLSAGMLVGLMGIVGEPLNIINNIVPILVLIMGVSEAVHFTNRYGEELTHHRSRRDAARAALAEMLVPMFLTSFTSAVGFLSLVMSDVRLMARFGVTTAIGLMIAYLVTVTFLPTMLSFMPVPRRPIADTEHGRLERIVGTGVGAALRHRWLTLAIAAAIAAGAALLARGVPVDTAIRHQYDQDSAAYHSIDLLERKLGGVRPVEVSLVAEPGRFHDPEVVNALDAVTRWARGRSEVLVATSYADLLREAWFVASGDPAARQLAFDTAARMRTLATMIDAAPSQLGRFVTADRDRARISLQLADVGGKATVAFVGELRAVLAARLPPDVRTAITGEGYTSSAALGSLTRELVSELFSACVVIFGIMTITLRSLRLGLLSIPVNLLPLVATIAYLRLRGIPLSPGTAIIFSVSVGMAVDGTVHILSRFREALAAGAPRDEALRTAVVGTGKAVVVSYLSIVIGFTVFLLSSFVPVRQFGELVSVTMAICMLSTVVILPTLIAVVYRVGRPPRDTRP